MPGQAVAALAAGNVVRGKNPIADFKIFDAGADLRDFPGNFMTQNERGFLDPIPFHQVAAADAAGARLDKKFAWTDFRHRNFFQAHVPVVVVHRDAHHEIGFHEELGLRGGRYLRSF